MWSPSFNGRRFLLRPYLKVILNFESMNKIKDSDW
jgi:hypothetical protein